MSERNGLVGEKGNLTSAELAAAAEAGVTHSVIAGAGTTVTAIVTETGDTLKDKVIDKGTDAGIAGATEAWRSRRGSDPSAADGESPGSDAAAPDPDASR